MFHTRKHLVIYILELVMITGVVYGGFLYQHLNYSFRPSWYTASVINTTPQNTKIINSLTLKQKISQLFIVGIDSQNINEVEQFIQQYPIGGVILLTKNFQDENQTRKLTNKLQTISKQTTTIPLLIAVDQEGGMVSRVPFSSVESTPQTDIVSPAQAYAIAKQRGENLRDLGITMNFAPVLDVITNKTSFLYKRVFQGDIQKISELGVLSTQGYRDANILSCIKHFPGHGDSLTDPHETISINNQTIQEIQNNITPFIKALSAGTSCVMVGHTISTAISPLPASQSPQTMHMLRSQEKLNGIIITDDMEMAAAHPDQTIAQASLRALQAGADMILISGYTTTSQEREDIIAYVFNHIKNGALSLSELNEKISRILKIKNIE